MGVSGTRAFVLACDLPLQRPGVIRRPSDLADQCNTLEAYQTALRRAGITGG